MVPEEFWWDGSGDRPGVAEPLGFIRKGDLDFINTARRTIAQRSSNKGVDELAE